MNREPWPSSTKGDDGWPPSPDGPTLTTVLLVLLVVVVGMILIMGSPQR